jgi:hypothetical protein
MGTRTCARCRRAYRRRSDGTSRQQPPSNRRNARETSGNGPPAWRTRSAHHSVARLSGRVLPPWRLWRPASSRQWTADRTSGSSRRWAPFDPLREGFQVHGNVSGTVVSDATRSALIGWSTTTADAGGGYYFRPLRNSQKRRALSRGWSLTTVMQASEGGGQTNVDFAPEGRRFDNVFAEPDANLVRLNTQIVPIYEGLEVRLPRGEPAYHKFELRFDPSRQAADLWIDGEKLLSGYLGHTQFQEETLALTFGSAPIRSLRGVASILNVRFESGLDGTRAQRRRLLFRRANFPLADRASSAPAEN